MIDFRDFGAQITIAAVLCSIMYERWSYSKLPVVLFEFPQENSEFDLMAYYKEYREYLDARRVELNLPPLTDEEAEVYGSYKSGCAITTKETPCESQNS